MFVVLGFGDFTLGLSGHVGVLLTGLGKHSCFLHYTGSDDSYNRKHFATDYHVGDAKVRLCIPTIQDGNANGLDEERALYCWRLYKHLLFRDGTVNRRQTLSDKYFMATKNCAYFANHFLIAACNGRFGVELQRIDTPAGFVRRAKEVRRQVLALTPSPVYGPVLEYSLMRRAPQRGIDVLQRFGTTVTWKERLTKGVWPCYTPSCEGERKHDGDFNEDNVTQFSVNAVQPPWSQRNNAEFAHEMYEDRAMFLTDEWMNLHKNPPEDKGGGKNDKLPRFRDPARGGSPDLRQTWHAQFQRLTQLGIKPLGMTYDGGLNSGDLSDDDWVMM